MYNYSAMEVRIKALESEVEHLKCIAQINEEHFKIQTTLFNETIKTLNNSDSVITDSNNINEVANNIHASMSDGDHYDPPFTYNEAYLKCEEKHGDIYLSEIDDLLHAVILYTLEKLKTYAIESPNNTNLVRINIDIEPDLLAQLKITAKEYKISLDKTISHILRKEF
jgi:hypothetical protein